MKNGFQTKAYDLGNTAKRKESVCQQRWVRATLRVVNGYVFEGHVPASEIHRLLKESLWHLAHGSPNAHRSPGMDGSEYGGQKDKYDVLLVTRSLTVKRFASYHGTERLKSFFALMPTFDLEQRISGDSAP